MRLENKFWGNEEDTHWRLVGAAWPASVKACLSGRVKPGAECSVNLGGRNTEASGWVQISNVHQPLSLLACDFVTHDTVKYIIKS